MSDTATARTSSASHRLRELPALPGKGPVLGDLAGVKPPVAPRQLEDWGRMLAMPYRLRDRADPGSLR